MSYSPLQRLEDARLNRHKLQLFIKRDDLLTPSVSMPPPATLSGNKLRKLKYNVSEMRRQNLHRIVTFGGAFSNHIHATAAAGQFYGFETIGIIRGERPVILNKTLTFAEHCGMVLEFVTRTDYRDKTLIINNLQNKYAPFYLLPEGGSNGFALKGAAEVVPEIRQQLGTEPDYICLACGTGATTAGIIAASSPIHTHVLSFAVLKGNFLQNDVTNFLNLLENASDTEGVSFFIKNENWSINNDYHIGGYGRWSNELIDFINDFKKKHGIALDPIYTGKMMFGIFKLIEKGYFKENSRIIALHTGGLQGIEGFNDRFGNLIQ